MHACRVGYALSWRTIGRLKMGSPNWLILHVTSRPDAKAQSAALGEGLTANGADVSVVSVPDSSHSSINKDAGTNGTFTANAIVKFLAQHVTNIRN